MHSLFPAQHAAAGPTAACAPVQRPSAHTGACWLMEAPAQIPSAHLHMVYLHIYVYTHTSIYIHVYVYVYIHIYGVTVLRLPAEDYKCNFLLGAVHSLLRLI